MSKVKPILFLLFFVSGFCSLLYQVVWLRMAFASFGIVTPVLSTVIAVFMTGLGIGTFLGGKLAAKLIGKGEASLSKIYGIVELTIGIGALLVPTLFLTGENILLNLGEQNSATYLFLSAVMICLSILPWCICMGATTPIIMGYVRQLNPNEKSSFSFLYFANVVGATFGCLLTALVLIEMLGFKQVIFVGVGLNILISLFAFFVLPKVQGTAEALKNAKKMNSQAVQSFPKASLALLFYTGFASMGMEVGWTRAFTPVVRTTIYSFAMLLATYLIATWFGSFLYRRHLKQGKQIAHPVVVALTTVAAFLPVLVPDPRLMPSLVFPGLAFAIAIVLLSIFPFCFLLGYLTPGLIDKLSDGEPQSAAKLYLYNIVGSIVGPLLVGYFMLPRIGVRQTLILLSLPFVGFLLVPAIRQYLKNKVRIALGLSVGFAVFGAFFSLGYEDPVLYQNPSIFRDYTATVINTGEGMHRMMYVNGIGITEITPVTKVMAHMPLAYLSKKPESALVICFGMGTTFRSLMSWGLDRVSAIELVPSVLKSFPFYHDDAQTVLADQRGQVIIDDGRRFLKRTTEKFDVITLDPPPPVEAAGSSLLYTREMLKLIKAHLTDGGILQHWFPGGDERILVSIAKAIGEEFTHVHMYRSLVGWGYHFVASDSELKKPTVEEFITKLPEKAKLDLLEWADGKSLPEYVATILNPELPFADYQNHWKALQFTDFRPVNEYFLLHRIGDKISQKFVYAK